MRGWPSTCWSRAIPKPRASWCEEKDRLRDREKETSPSHFLRLRDGTAKSVETSSIHLDTIRDLKQINSLLASMAYPVLEEHGLLRGSRLSRRIADSLPEENLNPGSKFLDCPRAASVV